MGDLRIHPSYKIQKDIDESGIDEIVEMLSAEPDSAILKVETKTNLRAMTAMADRPWWTARDDRGRLVGCVQVSRLGDSYSRLANFFVSPLVRGHGVGSRLYKAATADLEVTCGDQDRAIQIYQRQHVTKHISCKYWPNQQIDSHAYFAFGIPETPQALSKYTPATGFNVVPLKRGRLFDKLVCYDTAKIHEIPRREFLSVYFGSERTTAYVAVDKAGDVVGYGGIQTAINPSSRVLAPLYADSPQIAAALMASLMDHTTPDNNLAMIVYGTGLDLVHKIGLPVVETIDNVFVNFAHPEQFKKSVYCISNCGLVFN